MEFNLAVIAGAVADALPDRDYFVQGSLRHTFQAFMDRAHRLGNALVERGLGCHTERNDLAGHESGRTTLRSICTTAVSFLRRM